MIYWLNAHNPSDYREQPGVFVFSREGRLCPANTAEDDEYFGPIRLVTVIDAPAGLDTSHPGSAENIPILWGA